MAALGHDFSDHFGSHFIWFPYPPSLEAILVGSYIGYLREGNRFYTGCVYDVLWPRWTTKVNCTC